MAVVPSLERQFEVQSDHHPLLMELQVNGDGDMHVSDTTMRGGASSSGPNGDDHNGYDESHYGDGPSRNVQVPVSQPYPSPPAAANSRNVRNVGISGRHHRSPLNSGLWISVELVVNVSQIIAATVVLSLSRHERPQTPLFEWVIGYTAGCIATIPHIYWRYRHRYYPGSEQESAQAHNGSSQTNTPEPTYTITVAPDSEGDNHTTSVSRSGRFLPTSSPRCNTLFEYFKMALDCFFALWFVVGNVWVFGGRSSITDAPNLYRLCLVFLTFSCIGYAMPFILCAMICCCLPCIISIMGFREDTAQKRGATNESISVLPTYKFKSKGSQDGEGIEAIHLENQGVGGVLASGTVDERTISVEDAVCCICLAKYVDGDDVRELPCKHFFHMECVDKWLKINALCPLCKSEVGNTRESA